MENHHHEQEHALVVEQAAKKPRLSANESLPAPPDMQHGETTEIIMQDNSHNPMGGVDIGFFENLQDEKAARYLSVIQNLHNSDNKAVKYLIANLVHRPKKRYIIIPKEYRHPQRTKSVPGYGIELERLDWTNNENSKGGHYHKWRAGPGWDQNTFFRIIEGAGVDYIKSIVDYANLEKEFTDTPLKRKDKKGDEDDDEGMDPSANGAEIPQFDLSAHYLNDAAQGKVVDLDKVIRDTLAVEIDKRGKEIEKKYRAREQELIQKLTLQNSAQKADREQLFRGMLEDIIRFEDSGQNLYEEIIDQYPMKDIRKFKSFIVKLNEKLDKAGKETFV